MQFAVSLVPPGLHMGCINDSGRWEANSVEVTRMTDFGKLSPGPRNLHLLPLST